MSDSEKAKELLCHYFRTAFEAAGLKWDCDNDCEVREAVDAILRAAGVAVKR